MEMISDILRHQVAKNPEQAALVFEGRETSYGELDSLSNQVANGLVAEGLKSQSRIGYIGKNSAHYLEILYGCVKTGAVLIPATAFLPEEHIEFIIADAGVELLFVDAALKSKIEPYLETNPQLAKIIYLDNGDDYCGWRDSQATTPIKLVGDPYSTVLQCYTSGTTGNPKGVLLSHQCILERLRSEQESIGWTEIRHTSLLCVPIAHFYGTLWALLGMASGALTVIQEIPDPHCIADAIDEFKITIAFVIPAMLPEILDYASARNLSFLSLKTVVYGGSKIAIELLQDTHSCSWGYYQIYGISETGSITFLGPKDHAVEGKVHTGSCGKPGPGIEIKIFDSDGKELPENEIGEIRIKTPCLMVGYWQLEEKTREVLKDGWFLTGDAGYLDEENYLYVCDRIKDVILSRGRTIYPSEVEKILNQHPAVKETAVIGLADKAQGEIVKAVVVKNQQSEVSASELVSYSQQYLDAHKVPAVIEIREELPRNPSGKVLKTVLRESKER